MTIEPLAETKLKKAIADFLCEEAWQGRWHPRAETNIRPMAVHTAEVLNRLFEEWGQSRRQPTDKADWVYRIRPNAVAPAADQPEDGIIWPQKSP